MSFGGIEPVQRFYEEFQRPLDAAHAAAAVGLETETFLRRSPSEYRFEKLGIISAGDRDDKTGHMDGSVW